MGEAALNGSLQRVERKYHGMRQALWAEAGVLILIAMLLMSVELVGYAASGAGGLLALVLALGPVPLLYALGLWLDRYEPEPAWLLARTFLWGAAVAIVVAGVINSIVAAIAGEAVAVVFSAPVVEEAMKGLAILFIFRRRRDELNGVLDGVIYALFVGLGFAVVENVQYYYDALDQHGPGVLAGTVLVRGVLTPFLHPFFTMFTGVALAMAAQRTGSARVLLPLAGYGCAVFAHALWNSGIGVVLYPFVLVPFFIWAVVRIKRHRRAQAALLLESLSPEVRSGLIDGPQLQRLHEGQVDLSGYFASLRSSDHPLHRWRRFHHAAFALAVHRAAVTRRIAVGITPRDADRAEEAVLRQRVWDLRQEL